MAITVRFQSLSHANHEILKTFNSSTAEKALEAYQPLTEKERKLRKLRALQILKQSSNSSSLNDISLDNYSLALALKNAEGATLQAMLNLLSAKMIEQNKTLVNKKTQELKEKQEEERKEKLKAEKAAWEEAQEKAQEEKLKEETESQKGNAEKLIEKIINKFEDLKKATLKAYQDTLDFFTLKRLKAFYDTAIESMKDFLYRQPREYFETEILEPILDIPNKIQTYIESGIHNSIAQYKRKLPKALSLIAASPFSKKDLKFILEKSVTKENLKINKQKPLSKQEAIASLHQ